MTGAEPSVIYHACTIKRDRRTHARIEQLDQEILSVLQDDHPQSVRHVFYRMTDPQLVEPLGETERGYRHVQDRIAKLRRAHRLPFGWITDATRCGYHTPAYPNEVDSLREIKQYYRADLWEQFVHFASCPAAGLTVRPRGHHPLPERPEEWAFRFDPVQRVLVGPGRYIAAALTIVRSYIAAGLPGTLTPLASYGAWSDLVRSSLVWLGCADTVGTMKDIRDNDPVLTTLRNVLECWRNVFGDDGKTAAEVAALYSRGFDPDGSEGEALTALRAALAPVAAVRSVIDARSLAYWLRGSKGRPAGDLKFIGTPGHGGTPRWSAVPAR